MIVWKTQKCQIYSILDRHLVKWRECPWDFVEYLLIMCYCRSTLRRLLRVRSEGNRTAGSGCRMWSVWGPVSGFWRRCWWRCWGRLGICASSDGPAWSRFGSLGSTPGHLRLSTLPLFSVRYYFFFFLITRRESDNVVDDVNGPR